MIRLVAREDDCGMAANIGGAVQVKYRTFDLDLPEVEAWLRDTSTYSQRQIVGIELSAAQPAQEGKL